MKDELWIELIGAPACCDCRFYEEQNANEDRHMGICRRFPPVRQFKLDAGDFAEVASSDWCGEFELTASARRAFEAEALERWNGRLK